jgi:amino acid transporter
VTRERSVGLWGAVAIGIGGMVGGGIFAVLGVVATEASGGAPLAFLIAGVIALLTAVSYARLSVAYPSRGGSVVFVDKAFGVGTLTGALNNLLWFGYLVTLSLYAVAFASYAATFFSSGGDVSPWLRHGLICAAIIIPTGLNLLSAEIVARTETAIVALKLTMLLFVGVVGTTTVNGARLSVSTWPSLPAIAGAGLLVFVAYEGFELIANTAEDIREPRRTLPRAFYIAVGSVIVLYVAIAAITVGSLAPDQIKQAADFALAEAAKPGLGNFGFVIVAGAAVLATFSAINATLYGSARLSYQIAREGELPPALERNVWSEPVGLLFTAGVSLLVANTLNITEISALASSVFLIVFGATNAAALNQWRDIKASRVISGLGVAGCLTALLVLVINTTHDQPAAVVLLGLALVLAIGAEALWLRHRREVSLTNLEDGG